MTIVAGVDRLCAGQHPMHLQLLINPSRCEESKPANRFAVASGSPDQKFQAMPHCLSGRYVRHSGASKAGLEPDDVRLIGIINQTWKKALSTWALQLCPSHCGESFRGSAIRQGSCTLPGAVRTLRSTLRPISRGQCPAMRAG